MAIRNIVKEGDPCLLKECRQVTAFDGRLHALLDDMRETLIDACGAGLAAPQVGVLRQVALVMADDETEEEVDEEVEPRFIEIINPQIIAAEGEQDGPEGCLSIPGKRGLVQRPMKVRVRAQDRHGNWFEHEAEGFEARAFCHEIDHLHGHLYTELVTEYVDMDTYDQEGQ